MPRIMVMIDDIQLRPLIDPVTGVTQTFPTIREAVLAAQGFCGPGRPYWVINLDRNGAVQYGPDLRVGP